jgi:flagellar protein FliO/FliZ
MASTGMALRMVISLAVVLCLLFVLARFTRRGRPRGKGPQMAVLSRTSVGSKASVAVVQLGERALVVGVTEQSVTLLSEATVAELAPEADEEPATAVAAVEAPSADAVVNGVRVRRVVVDSASAAPQTRAEAATDKPGRLHGSAISPDTWRRTVDAVRDLTVRR